MCCPHFCKHPVSINVPAYLQEHMVPVLHIAGKYWLSLKTEVECCMNYQLAHKLEMLGEALFLVTESSTMNHPEADHGHCWWDRPTAIARIHCEHCRGIGHIARSSPFWQLQTHIHTQVTVYIERNCSDGFHYSFHREGSNNTSLGGRGGHVTPGISVSEHLTWTFSSSAS